MPAVRVFVINLLRRPDRLEFMRRQLDALSIEWEPVEATDAQTATDAEIDALIDRDNLVLRMGRGSQCCAVTNFRIFEKIVAEQIPYALILQDDIVLSPDLPAFLNNLDWLPKGTGLVQLEKFGSANAKRLTGETIAAHAATGRTVHRLYSRTGGAGCFLVTLDGAKRILARKQRLQFPIDHFLFSPNLSEVFDDLKPCLVMPALAEQDMIGITSDISHERRATKTLGYRLRRAFFEVNRLPQQLIAIVLGARWREFTFRATSEAPRRTT